MPAFFAGKDSHVTLNGVLQFMTRVEISEEAGLIDVTNSESPTAADGSRYRERLGGFVDGELTLECVHDPTLARPVRGTIMPYVWNIGGGHSIQQQIMLMRARTYTSIEDAARVAYTGK